MLLELMSTPASGFRGRRQRAERAQQTSANGPSGALLLRPVRRTEKLGCFAARRTLALLCGWRQAVHLLEATEGAGSMQSVRSRLLPMAPLMCLLKVPRVALQACAADAHDADWQGGLAASVVAQHRHAESKLAAGCAARGRPWPVKDESYGAACVAAAHEDVVVGPGLPPAKASLKASAAQAAQWFSPQWLGHEALLM